MSERMLRVNSILRQVIAEEIERLSDARLDMVTVTGVDTSPDLRNAMVYIDVLGDPEPALEALRRASRRLQAYVGSQVTMKYTPRLEFSVDPAIVGGERIETILLGLRKDEEE